MEREPSGFPPSSAPCRYQQRTSGPGLIRWTLTRIYTIDIIEPPKVQSLTNVRPRVALPPCGVPVSVCSRSPAVVMTPDPRNAFTNVTIRLSVIRRRIRAINGVCPISSKETSTYYWYRGLAVVGDRYARSTSVAGL